MIATTFITVTTPLNRRAMTMATSAGDIIATPTPSQAGMVGNCNKFHLVAEGDRCLDIAAGADISLENFYKWNEGMGRSCTGLRLGNYVCVGVGGGTGPPATTTSSSHAIATPTPYQSGMVDNCDTFHSIESGDECAGIARGAGISLSDFYAWNSGVAAGCTGLRLGYYVCVGVRDAIPPTTTTTTSMSPPGNGIETPIPYQSGMVGDCDAFYPIDSGDECVGIAKRAGISMRDFYTWNSGVNTECTNLRLGHHVCGNNRTCKRLKWRQNQPPGKAAWLPTATFATRSI